jgi:hypothetical protein
MLDKIIAIYAITDDLLKAMEIGHKEDNRREMSDAEIITTYIPHPNCHKRSLL